MRKRRLTLLLIATTLVTLMLTARTRTTQRSLQASQMQVERIVTQAGDTTSMADALTVNPDGVELRGFMKRASDLRESFLITSRLPHRVSAVRLLLRYTTLNQELITERKVTVPVTLNPGETRRVWISSFDRARAYYFYADSKPRKVASPFKVAFLLVGYDVPVGY